MPKKESKQYRIIHDLSFGGDQSVNYHTSKSDATVTYELLDTVIDLVVECGRGALLAKGDIENAFRILPINPDSYHLLGFKWDNMWYYDRCLPMGCSISCRVFESFSNSIQWILQNKLDVKYMSHILDDFIFVGPSGSNDCRSALSSFIALSDKVGIPIKHSKTVHPTTVATVHGIELDSGLMIARLPQDKLDKIRCLLVTLSRRKKTTLKEIQSIVGLLNFACRVIVPGRAFLRRLINLTIGVQSSHHIRITSEARADLSTWLEFITSFNGVTLLVKQIWVTSDTINLYTDASGSIGYGAVMGSHWSRTDLGGGGQGVGSSPFSKVVPPPFFEEIIPMKLNFIIRLS